MRTSPFRAARSSECSPSFSADGRFLMLSCYVLDTITGATDPQLMELGDKDVFRTSFLKLFKDIIHERVLHINWQHVAEVSKNKKYVTGTRSFENSHKAPLLVYGFKKLSVAL